MHFLTRTLQRLRRSKKAGVGFVLLMLVVGVVGNALSFLYFDGPANPDMSLQDAVWYSLISVTTIGYGDLSASSLGARLGTIFFIVVIGLSSFSAALGLLVDGMMQLNFREINGLAKILSKDHILIINLPDRTRVERIIAELREDPRYRDKDIVLVTDRVQTRPIDLAHVFFVNGSPLQVETLEQAGLERASMAIVLCTAADDPSSDGQVASVINLIEHLNPQIKSVAECLDERHEILFRSTNCDSVVYSGQVVNNLLVQETQEHGIASLVTTLTKNSDFTFYSFDVDGSGGGTYQAYAENLAAKGGKLIAVMRDGAHHIICETLSPQKGDTLIYVAPQRLELRALETV